MDIKKMLVGLSATAIMLLSLLAPMLFTQVSAQAFPYEDYCIVNGVLATDYYVLYPFEKKNLTLGFSKYGELIGIPKVLDPSVQANWIGLDYDGVDPFCPPDTIHMEVWINGWYIDVQYTAPTKIEIPRDRHIWAFAMFSDTEAWGGDWKVGVDKPNSPTVKGGRQTNTYAETENIRVLYNGPRLFVAETVTHIYDWFDYDGDKIIDHPSETWPVVDVIIKIIFEKVKKYVILFKDLKLTLPSDYLEPGTYVAIEFSNREQYDLPPDYLSYAHYYEQEGYTCYGSDWHVAKELYKKISYKYVAGGGETRITLPDKPIVKGFIKVWLNNNFLEEGTNYEVDYNAGNITLISPAKLAKNDVVEVHYIIVHKNIEAADWNHVYDVAQFISSNLKYVAFSAVWPPASDFTVDAWRKRLQYLFWPLNNVSEADMVSEPYRSPLLIAEWDILMAPGKTEHYRCVEVKGVVNRHDADDVNRAGGKNILDREVKYLLNEVFNPWDLNDAVEKDTMRFVKIDTKSVTATTRIDYRVGANAIISKEADIGRTGNPSGTSWYDYCNATERVIVDGVLISPERTTAPYYKATRIGNVWYINVTIPAGTHTIKILWSNFTTPGRYEWVIVGRDAHTVDSVGAAMVTAAFKDKIIESEGGAGAYIGLAGADMLDADVRMQMPYVMNKFGTGATRADYKDAIGRAALRDDWCTTWPVASSNLIAVGGPIANLLAYYANDFTPALWGIPEYAASAWANKIIALSCWSQKTYASSEKTGYAVVATYKDLNGTVLFLIWGDWGRDTYYATKWFHEKGIYELQGYPNCVTAIILRIDYTKHEPTVSVVEKLGTISELILHQDP